VEGGRGTPGVVASGKLISHGDRGDLVLTGRSLFLDELNTAYRGDLYRSRLPQHNLYL
jgi:hypothetical protein